MEIRAEKPDDIKAIRQVNIAAFGRESEADLVDRLRGISSTFSCVAVESGQVVGHIFFSPVTISAPSTLKEVDRECRDDLLILGLAPVAVLPTHQRQGIGTLLVQHGLKECDRLGCKAVFVLGSPEFYSRFGFTPAKKKGLKCEYTVPDEAFMVLELEPGALENYVGTIQYRSEFNELE